ncbi:hypothetical protein [Kocuria sp. CNJ-770]
MYQSTHAMAVYSTSLMVFSTPFTNRPGRMHSVLYKPMIDSIKQLS